MLVVFNKKISIWNIIFILIILSLIVFLYAQFQVLNHILSLNETIVQLNNEISSMSTNIKDLSLENYKLKNLIIEKENIIANLSKEHIESSIVSLSDKIITESPKLLESNNDKTKFLLKSIGVVLAIILSLVILGNFMPETFGLSKLLPESTYKFIQNHNLFMQKKILEYNYHDPGSNTDWIINIINNRLEIFAKHSESLTYLNLTDFIHKLQIDNNILSTHFSTQSEESIYTSVVYPTPPIPNIIEIVLNRSSSNVSNLATSNLPDVIETAANLATSTTGPVTKAVVEIVITNPEILSATATAIEKASYLANLT